MRSWVASQSFLCSRPGQLSAERPVLQIGLGVALIIKSGPSTIDDIEDCGVAVSILAHGRSGCGPQLASATSGPWSVRAE